MSLSFSRFRLSNIAAHVMRRKRARALDIEFGRQRDMKVPSSINIGKEICLSFLDELGTREDFLGIFLTDMYKVESINNLQKIKKVVDIRANQGFFCIYARYKFPHAEIYAYEPNPSLEPISTANCERVGAKVFMAAVGRNPGFVSLEEHGDSNLTRAKADDSGTLPLQSFGQVIENCGGQIDLLKLDCEGWEWEILDDKAALRQVRTITMEYHCWANNSKHSDIVQFLADRGFKVKKQRADLDFGQVLAVRADSV